MSGFADGLDMGDVTREKTGIILDLGFVHWSNLKQLFFL